MQEWVRQQRRQSAEYIAYVRHLEQLVLARLERARETIAQAGVVLAETEERLQGSNVSQRTPQNLASHTERLIAVPAAHPHALTDDPDDPGDLPDV